MLQTIETDLMSDRVISTVVCCAVKLGGNTREYPARM